MRILFAIPLLILCGTAYSSDYAAWAKKDPTGKWTAVTEEAVKASSLPTLQPTDITRFCPAYADLSTDRRVIFWTALISAIARPESNFKPETKFVEKDIKDKNGKSVVSRGLLQLSIESANAYSCKIGSAQALHDPSVNLRCGVRILSALVERDKIIASWGKDPVLGGARYWSTLRESRKYLGELSGFTKKLEACMPLQ